MLGVARSVCGYYTDEVVGDRAGVVGLQSWGRGPHGECRQVSTSVVGGWVHTVHVDHPIHAVRTTLPLLSPHTHTHHPCREKKRVAKSGNRTSITPHCPLLDPPTLLQNPQTVGASRSVAVPVANFSLPKPVCAQINGPVIPIASRLSRRESSLERPPRLFPSPLQSLTIFVCVVLFFVKVKNHDLLCQRGLAGRVGWNRVGSRFGGAGQKRKAVTSRGSGRCVEVRVWQ